jgi:deoxyribodipyrimidine photo-lyase
VIDGMADNARAFYPYIEPEVGAGNGLLETLVAQACVVVTDDYPAFFLPRMTAATANKLSVLCVPPRFSLRGLYCGLSRRDA